MSELLVYEREPKNAAVLARVSGLALCEVRSLTQLMDAIETTQPCVLCIQVRLEELPRVLSVTHQVKRAAGRPAVIGLPGANLRPYSLLLYEAGMDMLFWSMLDRDRASGLMRRMSRTVRPKRNLEEPLKSQVWSRLPWKRHATGGGSAPEKRNNGGI